jgi:hypothetical protein
MQVNLSLVAAMRQVFLRALPLPPVNITIPPTLHTQTSPATLGRTNGRSLETLRKKKNSALSGMGGALDGNVPSLSLNVRRNNKKSNRL